MAPNKVENSSLRFNGDKFDQNNIEIWLWDAIQTDFQFNNA